MCYVRPFKPYKISFISYLINVSLCLSRQVRPICSPLSLFLSSSLVGSDGYIERVGPSRKSLTISTHGCVPWWRHIPRSLLSHNTTLSHQRPGPAVLLISFHYYAVCVLGAISCNFIITSFSSSFHFIPSVPLLLPPKL